MKNKNSFGNDGLPIRVFKLGQYELKEIISKLINLSFSLGKSPDCLKIAKLLPVFKNGTKQLINNYRPISLLNVLSKIFEEVMKIRIVDYLEKKLTK